MRPAPLATLLAAALLTASFGAWPGPPQKRPNAASSTTPASVRFGRSVGSPSDGRLEGGMRLEEKPYLRICPAYAKSDVRWGLQPLVGMVDRAAQRVNRQFPGSVLNVGHLSRPGGGTVDRHLSHTNGRDVDIGFYVRNANNKPILTDRFVSFRADGTAPTWPGAHFDDARNWALVSALVTDPQAQVRNIFIANALRARLLAFAERVGAPIGVRLRAAEVMVQPRHAQPHDDHIHVRIACPEGMSSCVEFARPRAWARDQGRGRGSSPQRARGRDEKPVVPAKTTVTSNAPRSGAAPRPAKGRVAPPLKGGPKSPPTKGGPSDAPRDEDASDAPVDLDLELVDDAP